MICAGLREILADQTDAILDVWYGFVASTPELVEYFKNTKTGQPDGDYLGAVRKRFGQWILDTADANYDQAWLDYQDEIGRFAEAAGAYGQAIARGADTAAVHAALGEALTAAAGGQVVPEARQAFAGALERDRDLGVHVHYPEHEAAATAQAIERAKGGRDGKGGDAARACLRLVELQRAFQGQGA